MKVRTTIWVVAGLLAMAAGCVNQMEVANCEGAWNRLISAESALSQTVLLSRAEYPISSGDLGSPWDEEGRRLETLVVLAMRDVNELCGVRLANINDTIEPVLGELPEGYSVLPTPAGRGIPVLSEMPALEGSIEPVFTEMPALEGSIEPSFAP